MSDSKTLQDGLEAELLGILNEERRPDSTTYHGAFTGGGEQKLRLLQQSLTNMAAHHTVEVSRLGFVSIGGSTGTELNHVLSTTDVGHGVLLEHDQDALSAARKVLSAHEGRYELVHGDAVADLDRALMGIRERVADGSLDGVFVSCQALLHELASGRGQKPFHLSRWMRNLGRGFPVFFFTSRDPCAPHNWPEEVTVQVPGVSPESLRKFVVWVARSLQFEVSDSIAVDGEGVSMRSDLAVETLFKVFYRAEIAHEMEERVTSLRALDFYSAFAPLDAEMTVEYSTSAGFRARYDSHGIRAHDTLGRPLPPPTCFLRVTAVVGSARNDVVPLSQTSDAGDWDEFARLAGDIGEDEVRLGGVYDHLPDPDVIGPITVDEETRQNATAIRAELTINEPHLVLESPKSTRGRVADFATVKALRKAHEPPLVLSANALVVGKDSSSVVLHLRGGTSATYPGALHTVGGAFRPALGRQEGDGTLMRTVEREFLEETGTMGDFLPTGDPVLCFEEVKTGFVQFAVMSGRCETGDLSTSWEGRPMRVPISWLPNLIRLPIWVPTAWLHCVAWLWAGAPGATFAEPSPRDLAAEAFRSGPGFSTQLPFGSVREEIAVHEHVYYLLSEIGEPRPAEVRSRLTSLHAFLAAGDLGGNYLGSRAAGLFDLLEVFGGFGRETDQYIERWLGDGNR